MQGIGLIILQLVMQYGVPGAMRIYSIVTKHFEANAAPTPELWAELKRAEDESNARFIAVLAPPNLPPP